jgi:hypothetical protein
LLGESLGDTSPYQKLYQQFGAIYGKNIVPSKKKNYVMVNTSRTNPGQNNTHEDIESIGPEARIANLNQQLAQAQKNVEDLLAQNAVLQAARTPAPSQHVEGGENSRNEDDRVVSGEHPEGSGEHGNPRNELQGNQPPPPSTEAERRLQRMVQDLGAKYGVLSKTVAEKQGGKELLANIFQNPDSIFTDEVANTALPDKFKIPDIPIFTGSKDPMDHLMTFRSHTSLHKTPGVVVCRAFPLTLSGKA